MIGQKKRTLEVYSLIGYTIAFKIKIKWLQTTITLTKVRGVDLFTEISRPVVGRKGALRACLNSI